MILQLIFVIIYLKYTSLLTASFKFLRLISLFFISLYSFQLVLAIIDPYNISTPISLPTIIFFNLQIIFFICGLRLYLKYNKINTIVHPVYNYNINKFILFLHSLLFVSTFSKFLKMRTYMSTLGDELNQARAFYFTKLYASYTDMILDSILGSFVYISYFYMFHLFLFKREKLTVVDWYMILSTLSMFILSTMSSLGRGEIMRLGVLFIFFVLFSKVYYGQIFKKKIIPISVILGGVISIVLFITTLMRNNLLHSSSADVVELLDYLFLKPFASYFYVPVLAFDFGKDHIWGDLSPMFGGATFAGFIDFILLPFVYLDKNLGMINGILGDRMSPFFTFPVSGNSWNALFTGCSNYYIDFWYFGTMIFPLLHGYLLAKFTNKSLRSNTAFIILIFLFIGSYDNLVSSPVQSMNIVFLLLLLIAYKMSFKISVKLK